ncbi:MAG: tetratricopeptide repeat protein [Deltaproteobacteria bacterium]|nr:tetratricopeptide repeat protein [Deltaproteobacteria bacterium]
MDPVTPLERLGREVARAQDAQLQVSRAVAQARPEFLEHARAGARERSGAMRILAFAGTGVAAAAMAFLVVVLWPRAIEVRVGAAPLEGEFVSAGPEGRVPLRFTDGSAVDLEPGASARVLERRSRGVTLLLERGRLGVSVVHRDGADWRMRAGPFEVRVTGTRFDLQWSPAQGSLTLTGLEGSVIVVGCGPGAGIVLVTGQSLTASCLDGKLHLGGRDPLPGLVPAPPPPIPTGPPMSSTVALPDGFIDGAPLISSDDAPIRRSAPAPLAYQTAPPGSWLAHARQGRYVDAWAVAMAVGLPEICETAGAEELVELADAARYAGNYTGARRVFLVARQRFPGTPQAALAAFGLGRLAFDAREDAAESEGWFKTALAEQPNGPLARESLGRVLEARLDRGDRAGARQVARRYLDEYPMGPHAAFARNVLSEE